MCYDCIDVLAAEVVVVALVGELAFQLLHEVHNGGVILEVDRYRAGGDDLDRPQVLHDWVGGEVDPCVCCCCGQVGVHGYHYGRFSIGALQALVNGYGATRGKVEWTCYRDLQNGQGVSVFGVCQCPSVISHPFA